MSDYINIGSDRINLEHVSLIKITSDYSRGNEEPYMDVTFWYSSGQKSIQTIYDDIPLMNKLKDLGTLNRGGES